MIDLLKYAFSTDLQNKFTALEQISLTTTETPHDTSGPLKDKVTALEAELKQERDLHRKTRDHASKTAQNSVAELELRDYQRTIAQLNEKLIVKDDCILRVTQELQSQEQLLLGRQQTIERQAQHIEELTEKTVRLESALSEALRENMDKERRVSGLRDEIAAADEKIRG